jgi:glycerol-3-phosphate dehydrogenase
MSAGAVVATYTEAVGLLRRHDAICGVRTRDVMSGAHVDIRARVVLNATGPWAQRLLRHWLGPHTSLGLTFSRDTYVVVPRRLTGSHALALPAQTRDPDALLSRGARHLFLVPWRDATLIGVWHVLAAEAPTGVTVTEADLVSFLNEINHRLPFKLTPADISRWHAGLVLFGENERGARDLSYGKRSRLVDHAVRDHIDGLITMIGVRYTTARAVAERAIDLVFAKLGHRPPASRTAVTPVHGGRIERFDDFVRDVVRRRPGGLRPWRLTALLESHGSAYDEVLRYAADDPALGDPIAGGPIIKAQIIQAVRDELAVTLGDVVFRRTDLGAGHHPGEQVVRACADLMAAELEWSAARRAREIDEVTAVLASRHPAGSPAETIP